jgi:hypothetical protein
MAGRVVQLPCLLSYSADVEQNTSFLFHFIFLSRTLTSVLLRATVVRKVVEAIYFF